MGLFSKLRESLQKARGGMTERVDELVRETRKIDDDFYEELEDILILSDCGVKATTFMIDELKERVRKNHVTDAKDARNILKEIMVEEMNIPRPVLDKVLEQNRELFASKYQEALRA